MDYQWLQYAYRLVNRYKPNVLDRLKKSRAIMCKCVVGIPLYARCKWGKNDTHYSIHETHVNCMFERSHGVNIHTLLKVSGFRMNTHMLPTYVGDYFLYIVTYSLNVAVENTELRLHIYGTNHTRLQNLNWLLSCRLQIWTMKWMNQRCQRVKMNDVVPYYPNVRSEVPYLNVWLVANWPCRDM